MMCAPTLTKDTAGIHPRFASQGSGCKLPVRNHSDESEKIVLNLGEVSKCTRLSSVEQEIVVQCTGNEMSSNCSISPSGAPCPDRYPWEAQKMDSQGIILTTIACTRMLWISRTSVTPHEVKHDVAHHPR